MFACWKISHFTAEGNSFEEVISLAISIGGDSDTIAAIAGSMAEVIYPIPERIRAFVSGKPDGFLLDSLMQSVNIMMKGR